MSINWLEFLEAHNIEYISRGPSTSRDNVYVHCIFCGDADRGYHLGISLNGKGWGCWRESAHRGRSPVRLIQALLRCSWQEANRMAFGGQRVPKADSGLLDVVVQLLGKGSPPRIERNLKLLDVFERLTVHPTPHYHYMRSRSFFPSDIEELADRFNLRICWNRGPQQWRWRLIVPVYDERKRLLTWTGRAVGDTELRYRTLTVHPKSENEITALAPITNCFLNLSEIIEGGEFLVLVEGPFDCFRVALESDSFGAGTGCLFGKTISPAQLDVLASVRHLYKSIFLLLDPDAKIGALRLSSQLAALNVTPILLDGDADPGDLSSLAMRKLLGQLEDRTSATGK